MNSEPEEFTPLTIDLDSYEKRLELENKVRELARVKVMGIEKVFDEAFNENIDLMLTSLAPVLPADEDSVEEMAVRAFHAFKVEEKRADSEYIRGVKLVVLQSAIWTLSLGLISLLIFRLSPLRSLTAGLVTAPFASPILALRYK